MSILIYLISIVVPRMDPQDINSQYAAQCGDMDYNRQQVVAVGTPLPTSSLPIGTQQGPVMLTSKNLQAMRALLSLAHCHGGILGKLFSNNNCL